MKQLPHIPNDERECGHPSNLMRTKHAPASPSLDTTRADRADPTSSISLHTIVVVSTVAVEIWGARTRKQTLQRAVARRKGFPCIRPVESQAQMSRSTTCQRQLFPRQKHMERLNLLFVGHLILLTMAQGHGRRLLHTTVWYGRPVRTLARPCRRPRHRHAQYYGIPYHTCTSRE